MRVLLISPNRETLPDPVYPLGLAYVASGLMSADHEVMGLDLFLSDDIAASIRQAVADFDPEAIGISLRNIDDVSYPKSHSYMAEYKAVVGSIREYTRAPIILGGSGFTIMPKEFMRELGADYGIAGEGERAFPELLDRLKCLDRLRGPESENSGRISSAGKITALDELSPMRGLFDSGLYYRSGGMLNIQTKRGCAFGCVYCTYSSVEGRELRLRRPERVVDEIENVISMTGARHFFIVDSVFNHPAEHAMAICREIIARGLDIEWTCYSNPSSMTPELAGLMARAGCTGVEFGTDNLNDEGLKALGKNFDFKKIQEASGICEKAGLKFCHFIFIGAPGDTADRVKENFSKLDELNPDAAVIMAGIRIFPGTGLAKMAEEDLGIEGVGLSPVFYISPEVLEGMEGLAEEVSKRRKWAMPGLEINVYERLQRRLRECGIKGPLWEGLSERVR